MKIGGVLVELPPRARRIQQLINIPTYFLGTTSACAENTLCVFAPRKPLWNYLRVRGEYASTAFGREAVSELPPRARRILNIFLNICTELGTTSACAENTSAPTPENHPHRNYLRVRGEYTDTCPPRMALMELPPRARRIPHCIVCVV